MSRIAIIGAGIGGLGAANLLARQGHTVDIYEQASAPGGRAGLLAAEGFRFDTGPSWYLMPEVFEKFYTALGVDISEQLAIIRLNPSYKVFFEHDAPLTITGNLAADKATFEAIEPGAGAALERYAAQAKQLYDLSIRYFLYTDFSDLRDLLKPGIIVRTPKMLRMMTTSIHTFVSRFVSTTRLQQILEYPMVFLGTSPFEAPALYCLMGALDFDSGVYYPRGGIYTIIESLASLATSASVSLHYDTTVTQIVTQNGRATALKLKDGTVANADIIISNADLRYTETALLEAADQSFPEAYWQSKQPASSALLIYLGVKKILPTLEHHNLLFVDAWRENFDALYTAKSIPEKASLYLSRTSKTDPGVAPAGHETLFVLVPLPAGINVSDAQASEMAAHYIAQIETMTHTEIASDIVYQSFFTPTDFGSTFHSWQNSMLGPSHVLKQSAFWRTPNKSKKLSNLYYVGAGTLPGIGLPMCLIGAQNLAKRIAKEHTP